MFAYFHSNTYDNFHWPKNRSNSTDGQSITICITPGVFRAKNCIIISNHSCDVLKVVQYEQITSTSFHVNNSTDQFPELLEKVYSLLHSWNRSEYRFVCSISYQEFCLWCLNFRAHQHFVSVFWEWFPVNQTLSCDLVTFVSHWYEVWGWLDFKHMSVAFSQPSHQKWRCWREGCVQCAEIWGRNSRLWGWPASDNRGRRTDNTQTWWCYCRVLHANCYRRRKSVRWSLSLFHDVAWQAYRSWWVCVYIKGY